LISNESDIPGLLFCPMTGCKLDDKIIILKLDDKIIILKSIFIVLFRVFIEVMF